MPLRTMSRTFSTCSTSTAMKYSTGRSWSRCFGSSLKCWRSGTSSSQSLPATSSKTPPDSTYHYMKHSHPHAPPAALLALLLLVPALTALRHDTTQPYRLAKPHTHRQEVALQQDMRFTYVQTEGSAELKITTNEGETVANHRQGFAQGILTYQGEPETLVLTVEPLTQSAAGWIEVVSPAAREELRIGEEKWMHIRKGESRVLDIAPREGCVLTIQRLEGSPQFINNRCQQQERKECLDEMHRFSPVELRKHVETVFLPACPGCIMLTKITTASPQARLRVSINASRTTLPAYPTLFLIKKGEKQQTLLPGGDRRQGKVTVYSGAVQVSSEQMDFQKFGNGYTYSIKPNAKDEVSLVVVGQGAVSYLMMEAPSDPQRITLLDGLPTAHLILPNKTYTIHFQSAAEGRSNIVLSGHSQFLQRLAIKFTQQQTQQHYTIRPKYLLNTTTASQSFQLAPTAGSVRIELHLSAGESGLLNATCQVNQHISLPLDYPYSSILRYKEYDDYVLEGLSGSIDIHIRKCVDCVIKYAISENPITSMPSQTMQGTDLLQTHALNGSQLYLRVLTNNYAYYSLQATTHAHRSSTTPELPDDAIKFYLLEDQQNSLLLEMQPPICGSAPCKHANYYLMEGSDPKHLASKVYCPSALFDFDQRTKDIVLQHIHPTSQGQTVTHTRPMRHRDYLGIVVEVEGVLLPYRVISTQEVKLYREMRWPFFYLCLFFTAALFFTFLIFMALRRKGRDSGYVRASSQESQAYLG